MDKRDYYEVLGVAKDADAQAIKSAYRKKAMDFHPDRNPGDHTAEERFKEAAEAYEVLSNGEKRQLYDRFGHQGPRQAGFEGFSGVEDIFSHFSDLFGGDFFGGRGRGSGGGRGADLQTRVELSFLEAMKGCQKEISFERQVRCERCSGSGAKAGTAPQVCKTCRGQGQVVQSMGFMRIATTCPSCRGQGRVITERCDACRGQGVVSKSESITIDIPAGVDNGRALRIAGRGEQAQGGTAGNLYVEFSVARDPRFERHGDDLITEVEMSFAVAALGGELAIPTIEGSETVKIAAGTQSGTVHTLRSHGAPRIERGGHGDLHARLHVVVPRALTDEQRKLIAQLGALDGQTSDSGPEPEEEEERGFFRRKKKKTK